MYQALVCGRTIFLWDADNNLRVFDLPTTYSQCPTGTISDIAPIIHRPKAEIPAFCIESMRLSSTFTWQSSSADQYVCTNFRGMHYFSLYSVKHSPADNDPFLLGSFLVPGGRNNVPYGPGYPGYDYYGDGLTSLLRFEDELITCSRSPDNALVVMIMPVPQKASLDEVPLFSMALTRRKAIHTDEGGGLGYQFDFCPFSGRAVYITHNRDVFVSDYVLPTLS